MRNSHQRHLVRVSQAALEWAYNLMFQNCVEGQKAAAAGIHTREKTRLIVKKLNLKVKTRALVKHDRLLCEDKRGSWHL